MAVRRILQLGDPKLRVRSQKVKRGETCEGTLNDLRDTLRNFRQTNGFGRGISAIQIGVPERIVYLDLDGEEYCLLNPEFTEMSEEKFSLWDDCFSFPNLLVRLERSKRVALRYMDENGRELLIEADGALSELLQHEVDHLDGVLAVDRALDDQSLMTREEWLRQGL